MSSVVRTMWLRAFWRVLQLFAHLLVGAVLTLALARRNADGSYRYRPDVVHWWHGRACRILGIHVDVSGTLPDGAALLVANHVSWLDIPVLGSAGPIAFLSKAEVRDWPVMGWLAAAAGTHFIARGSGEASSVGERMGNHLQARGCLALFPEGTTTDGRQVKPFYPRLLGAAVTAGVPVVPVALRYHRDGALDPIAPFVGEETLASHLRRTLCARRFDVQVVFGAALDPSRFDRRSLARRAHDEVVVALARLGGDGETHQAGD
ncbi:MAG: 1-acyl-sn-glycerol-3-phosphate acyltransferase [Gammaproteobacteria bacterium]|nr:1-acyl-sn-glycerol-3-phosphate acyltransferase [Gammaproteobacteria bacterium]